VITTRAQRPQATDGFAETRSTGELREDHAEQLIHAGKAAELLVPGVPLDRRLESAPWKKFEQLSEDGAAGVHDRIVTQTDRSRPGKRPTKLKSCTLTSA